MDECYHARINMICGRFPIETFREQFVKTFSKRGMVLIQGKAVPFRDTGPMQVDSACGFIFTEQRLINIAVRLCRRWGFNVERHEHRNSAGMDLPAYSVTFPEEYLRNRISSDALGRMKTYARSNAVKENRKAKPMI